MFYEWYTIQLYHFCRERYAKKRKEIRIYDTSTFHLPRQDCRNAVKSVLYGVKWGVFFALVVVGDYGYTTNGKMKNRKCE